MQYVKFGKTKLLFEKITVIALALLVAQGRTHAADFSAWKHRLPITLMYRDDGTKGQLPIDVTFSLLADFCADPQKELRLVLKTASGEEEVPFQLSRFSRWTKDTDGKRSMPTLNGRITFFDDSSGNGNAEYFLLYGNTNAAAPNYPTDLQVSGKGPAWVIENSKMIVRLHGRKDGVEKSTNHDSGQISAVILKANPDVPYETKQNVLHWDPDIFIPTRRWSYPFLWDPPESCEIVSGPIFVEVRRSGPFPDIEEAHLAVNYRIFANRSYIESGTIIRIQNDVGVAALRNDELIFPEGFFTHVGWDDNGRHAVSPMSAHKRVNKHGDILRFSPVADYVAFFNPSNGVGAATVRESFAAIGPDGAPAPLCDNATYVTLGNGLQYWFRALIFLLCDSYDPANHDHRRLATVPKGSIYADRNYYLFYVPEKGDPVSEPINLSRSARMGPDIKVGDVLPPSR